MSDNQRELLLSFFPEKKKSRVIVNGFVLFMDWDFSIRDWKVIVSKYDNLARNQIEQEARIQTLL
jgi:hypothetical protein